MSAHQHAVFDHQTELARGITLLEASAGTGKTYQITNLVLRMVLELDISLPEILVVTFTHAATAELKERIRQRIGAAQRALEQGQAPPGDTLLAALVATAQADPEQGKVLRRRTRRAREEFDQAVISTIHGFCQRMLRLNAFESGTSFGRDLVADDSDAIRSVVDDFIVQRLHSAPEAQAQLLQSTCGWTRDKLTTLARLALSDPDLPLVPPKPTVSAAAWLERVSALRTAWATASEPGGPVAELTRLVAKKGKAFDGRTYGARYAETRATEAAHWLAAPVALPGAATTWVRWFSPTQLTDKASSAVGQSLAADPLFAEWADVHAAGEDLIASARCEAVLHLRAALAAHHIAANSQTFHDLLRDLDRTLADPSRGPVLANAIRGRFKAALIDEFQDTDALQWRIFGRVFGGIGAPDEDTSDHLLYLIGDPKQAIYGFRGANVHVYLKARSAAPAERQFTMRRNFRSDEPLVAAMNHMLNHEGIFGAGGDEGSIRYVHVDAHNKTPGITWPASTPAGDQAPLQLVWATDKLAGESGDELLGNGPLHELLASRCAADVVRLLRSGAEIRTPSGDKRAVAPGDIAVLVRGHAQGRRVWEALGARGVPGVIASQGNVFETAEAVSLARWLAALDPAANEASARLLATDPLLGCTVADLPTSGDEPQASWWTSWLDALARWRRRFQARGLMPAFRALMEYRPPWTESQDGLAADVLAVVGGERRMTDLLHLAELLHAQEAAAGLQLGTLRTWLDRQRLEKADVPDAAELRLEKDDAAVQIVTVHRAKGLQYPVVFVPFAWGDEGGRAGLPMIAPHPDNPSQRRLVLTTQGDDADAAVEAQQAELRREGVRLLYVALTRAIHRCTIYWPGVPPAAKTGNPKPRAWCALAAVFHGCAPGEQVDDRVAVAAARASGLSPIEQRSELVQIAAGAAPLIHVSDAEPPEADVWVPPAPVHPPLRPRKLSRAAVDDGWRRHSYSALTRADLAAQREELVDPVRGLGFDDDRVAGHSGGASPHPAAASDEPDVPLARFPAGADAGTCLHAIFEFLDFHRCIHEDDGPEHLQVVLRRQLGAHGFNDPALEPIVSTGFPAVLRTPLGPLLPNTTLGDIPLKDRLDELRFDFPVAGAGEGVTAAGLSAALALRDPDDTTVPRDWIDRVALLDFPPLVGFMTGSIDLVFRAPSHGHMRWYVADYKSNRLDPDRTGRTPASHFGLDPMRHEMAHHHYFLQYHLYTLALHRMLKWRLGPAYSYEDDMGGVLYLFVRGMTGPDAVTAAGTRGVFCDRPPFEVIDELDTLFGRVEVPQ